MTVFLFETKRELAQLARLAPDSRQVYVKHSSGPKDAHPGVRQLQRVCRRPRPTRRIFATPRSGATDPGLRSMQAAAILGQYEIKETCFSGGLSRLVQLFQVWIVIKWYVRWAVDCWMTDQWIGEKAWRDIISTPEDCLHPRHHLTLLSDR